MHDEGGVVVSVSDERVSRYKEIFEGSAFFQRTDSSMRNFSPGNFEQIFMPTKSLMGQEKSLKCAFAFLWLGGSSPEFHFERRIPRNFYRAFLIDP